MGTLWNIPSAAESHFMFTQFEYSHRQEYSERRKVLRDTDAEMRSEKADFTDSEGKQILQTVE